MIGDCLLVEINLWLGTWFDHEVAGWICQYTLAANKSEYAMRHDDFCLLSRRDILEFDQRVYVKDGGCHLLRLFQQRRSLLESRGIECQGNCMLRPKCCKNWEVEHNRGCTKLTRLKLGAPVCQT